jgi:hypothetical protein
MQSDVDSKNVSIFNCLMLMLELAFLKLEQEKQKTI